MDSILATLAIKVSEIAIKNTASSVMARINSSKAQKDSDVVVNEMEEIIRGLLDDKSELLNVIKVYEEEFVAQKISEEDFQKIQSDIIPAVKDFIEEYAKTGTDPKFNSDEILGIIESVKPLLSLEILKILQIIGFNYKKALGEPLTELSRKSINKPKDQVEKDTELNKSLIDYQVKMAELSQDEEAYQRYLSLISMNQ